MTEKTFNRIFNWFILGGMLITVGISIFFKFQNPDANRFLLLVSGFGALCGVASTVLSANGIIWTFVFGLIDVLIYSYGLFDNGAWSTLLLHLGYFVPMEFIGFFQWRKRGAKGDKPVKAQRMEGKHWISTAILFVLVLAASFGISWMITSRTGGSPKFSATLLDAMVTTANIVALVLMTMAYMEQWYLWTLVNISSVILWTVTLCNDPSSYTVVYLVKYVFYLINGINGIRIWMGLSRGQASGEAFGNPENI